MLLSTFVFQKKIYNDLESKYADLKKETRSVADENAALLQAKIN
jgi:chemotaxis protein MotB